MTKGDRTKLTNEPLGIMLRNNGHVVVISEQNVGFSNARDNGDQALAQCHSAKISVYEDA